MENNDQRAFHAETVAEQEAAGGGTRDATAPTAYIQATHLEKAKDGAYLCRVEGKFREGMGLIPIYTSPVTAAASAQQDEREAFEAWHDKFYGPQDKYNPVRSLAFDSCGYIDPTVQAQFVAFCGASAALSQPQAGEIPPPDPCFVCGDSAVSCARKYHRLQDVGNPAPAAQCELCEGTGRIDETMGGSLPGVSDAACPRCAAKIGDHSLCSAHKQPAPATGDEREATETYLCLAWGETDFPAAAIVTDMEAVRAFLIEQWLGSADETDDDGANLLDWALQDMREQWALEGEAWKWEVQFEIGGVSVRKVADFSPVQASAAHRREDQRDVDPAIARIDELFKNRMTPYGMLVRALRIVAGATLMEMSEYLSVKPSQLSAMEFGRAPVTYQDAVDAAGFFSGRGVMVTLHALEYARDAAMQRTAAPAHGENDTKP